MRLDRRGGGVPSDFRLTRPVSAGELGARFVGVPCPSSKVADSFLSLSVIAFLEVTFGGDRATLSATSVSASFRFRLRYFFGEEPESESADLSLLFFPGVEISSASATLFRGDLNGEFKLAIPPALGPSVDFRVWF